MEEKHEDAEGLLEQENEGKRIEQAGDGLG
jgi:hypothetical protein